MNVTIIIPNYNGVRFLPDCLNSIKKQTYTDYSVTVVDNGSSDGSIKLLETHYPEVSVIRLSHNSGFASACNIGIRSCHSPYIMLLNNDTILAPDCLNFMVKKLIEKPNIFSAGSYILSINHSHRIDTSGDFYTLFGYAFCRDQGFVSDTRRPPDPLQDSVFTNCGCAALYRRSLLKKTGLLDPAFFAYLEDVDLGIRARRLGYENVHCPEAIVYHIGSATTGTKYSEFKVFHSARNNMWLRRKNLTRIQRLLHFPFVFTGSTLKYLYFRKIGLGKAYFRGCIRGLSSDIKFNPPKESDIFRTEPWILYGTYLYVKQFLQKRLLP